jgi:hypothetical protein
MRHPLSTGDTRPRLSQATGVRLVGFWASACVRVGKLRIGGINLLRPGPSNAAEVLIESAAVMALTVAQSSADISHRPLSIAAHRFIPRDRCPVIIGKARGAGPLFEACRRGQ